MSQQQFSTVPVTQLAGTSEVAELLGCHKQQLQKLRMRPEFPEPVITLAATPVWDMREVRRFKDGWRRRKVLDTTD